MGAILLRYDLTAARAEARKEVVLDTASEIVIALLVIALLAVLLRRWVARPLAHLQTAVRNISRGELDTEIAVGGRSELAELAADIQSMQQSLREAADERGRHEQSLRTSAQDLAVTLHSIGDAVITTDAAGLVTRINPAAERLTGWPASEALGKPLGEVLRIVDALTRVPAEDPVQRVLARNGVVELANHTTLIGRDGVEHQIADSAAPIRDASGRISGVVLVFSDVSEQYRVREELTRVTEMLEHTGVLAKVGGWEFDLRNNQLFWSRETCRIHEIDPPVTPPLADAINFYAPEARPIISQLVQGAIERGEPYDVELPLITATGRPIWVRAQCSPQMQEGRAVMLRGAFHDITERRRAEEQRAESERLLVNLAQQVPSAIYQYRLYPDGRSAFPYASPGIEMVYEVTPESVREDATPVFGRLHPDDLERVSALIMESARTLETFICEFRVILPRQGVRWRWSQAQPVRTEDGGTLWHGIISDITERKEAEAANADLQSKLMQAQRLESVGLLAGGVAHDFNNMLGVILGNVELAMQDAGNPSLLRTDLHEIRGAAQRSADLTRQLLAFARKQEVAPEVLNLNAQVATSLKMLQRLIGEHIALTWRPGAALWSVEVDPSQIDQILTNLCVNAQAAIDGVGEVTISTENVVVDEALAASLSEGAPGDYVLLTVSDTGHGMDAPTLARIFEPFFTTKQLGKGTGLGLSTVYGAVRQNRGFLAVTSQLGAGTTFRIYLPRYTTTAAPSVEEAPLADGAPDHGGGETILVVEDEAAMLKLTTRMLAQHGYTVLGAGTPREALRLAEAHGVHIHLLLTDVVMPGMNGGELAEALRSKHPHLRCVYMSGHTADLIARQNVLSDGVRLLEKPFASAQLAAVVREVLDRP